MDKKTTVLFCRDANAGATMSIQNTAGGPNSVSIQSTEIYTTHGVGQLVEELRSDLEASLSSLDESTKASIKYLEGNYEVIYAMLSNMAEELVQKALEGVLGDLRERIENLEKLVAESSS